MPHCRQDLLRDLTITRGDVVLAMRRAAAIIEQTYTTGAQEHVDLEPQGMPAVWDGDQVTVLGAR